jgi:hypothetical protein
MEKRGVAPHLRGGLYDDFGFGLKAMYATSIRVMIETTRAPRL